MHTPPVLSAAAPASLLFVQNADSGVLEPDLARPGDFLLHARGVGRTLYIADRPQRLSGSLATADFAASWESYGFDSDPPNAILETRRVDETIATAVVLRDPVYDDGTDTLTYKAHKLSDLPDFYDNARSGRERHYRDRGPWRRRGADRQCDRYAVRLESGLSTRSAAATPR
ncbi:MAG: hypothetical protein ABIR79_12515 [Candidatus Binatia bacterium]